MDIFNVFTMVGGLALFLYGMSVMGDGLSRASGGRLEKILERLTSSTVKGVLLGAVLTAIIQSSSASVGILQALCVTGAKKNAKRTAFLHFGFLGQSASVAGIAVVHTLFNVFATLLWLPFHNVLVKLAQLTVRDRADEERFAEKTLAGLAMLDDRFLENPAFAMAQCREACSNMAGVTIEALDAAISLLDTYDDAQLGRVKESENVVDKYEDRLGTYLVQAAKNEMQLRDSHTLSALLHSIGDIERISDHAVNIGCAAKEIYDKNLAFSDAAGGGRAVIHQ